MQIPLNTTMSNLLGEIDFRLVANGDTYIVVIGVGDDFYEYELYSYGSVIVDPFKSMYYVSDANSIMLYDYQTAQLTAKFMFKSRG